MYFKAVTSKQNDLLNTQESRTVLTVEPGAGATYALLLKAVKEATDGKFVVVFANKPSAPGGVVSNLETLLEELGVNYRYSHVSGIFTLKGSGKIKLMDRHSSDEVNKAASADWVLIDHNCYNFNTVNRGTKVVVVQYANEDRFSFFDEIRMYLSENFFIATSCPQYEDHARKVLPEKFFK